MTFTPETKNHKVDLTNCDREPIHIPGAVQSHGVLVVVHEPELIIERISHNAGEYFGKSAESLLGRPLGDLLAPESLRYLIETVLPQALDASPQYLPPVTIGTTAFEGIIHRFKGVLILEFETQREESRAPSVGTYAAFRTIFNELNRIKSLKDYCQRAAEAVREFTGFDRVMVYRFLEDGSGQVFAEARRDDLESFLHLHYPASDIPQQARALYKLNPVRVLPDAGTTPVGLIALPSASDEPLDMSHTSIRAMSPIHIEYLKNMGVCSSMSLSIMRDDELWGLFACHHYTPRYVPHAPRAASEFMAHLLSLQVGAKEEAENYEYAARLKDTHNALIGQIGDATLTSGLLREQINLLSEIEADGAAVLWGDEIKMIGVTPNETQLRELTGWLLETQPGDVFASTGLSRMYAPAAAYRASASGILAVRLMRRKPEYLLWFRGEYANTISWAGDPNKPVTIGEFGDRLTPRKSFALWRESVIGTSIPWLKCELEHAESLRRSLVEVIIQRAEEIAAMNEALERSNIELDAFAYVASHDLKEPLRGIHNYAHFLLEDYADKLDEPGKGQLQTMVRLTERMESLLDTLLHFSRLGRTELNLSNVDIQKILDDTLDLLRGRIEESNTYISVPRPLPTLQADEARLGEVFGNLIANAIKYNDKVDKQVEIGFVEQEDMPVFYVRDNGIGIASNYYENIFRIFKRLHGRNEFGGGVGAGLTIAKKIVERHGGQIWLESVLDKGTTFYFTLGQTAPQMRVAGKSSAMPEIN